MVGLISALIILPLTGAFALYVGCPRNARAIALIFNALVAFLALTLWRNFDSGAAGLQMVERHAWIPAIGAEYLVGVDGLSLLLVLLTSLIVPFALLAQPMDRGFYATMLVIHSALYGTFTAQNLVLWFLFYEMSLIPDFLLIKIWARENRDLAATKFLLYTFLASVSMVLTGVLSKMGVYGFVRLLLPLFPNQIKFIGPWLLVLAVCSIVFAPLAAWAQRDLKRMIAYLSVNHLGYCMLGLFAVTASPVVATKIDTHAAFSGVFMQIFNHGVTAAT